jgi:hypothetical protein
MAEENWRQDAEDEDEDQEYEDPVRIFSVET